VWHKTCDLVFHMDLFCAKATILETINFLNIINSEIDYIGNINNKSH